MSGYFAIGRTLNVAVLERLVQLGYTSPLDISIDKNYVYLEDGKMFFVDHIPHGQKLSLDKLFYTDEYVVLVLSGQTCRIDKDCVKICGISVPIPTVLDIWKASNTFTVDGHTKIKWYGGDSSNCDRYRKRAHVLGYKIPPTGISEYLCLIDSELKQDYHASIPEGSALYAYDFFNTTVYEAKHKSFFVEKRTIKVYKHSVRCGCHIFTNEDLKLLYEAVIKQTDSSVQSGPASI